MRTRFNVLIVDDSETFEFMKEENIHQREEFGSDCFY